MRNSQNKYFWLPQIQVQIKSTFHPKAKEHIEMENVIHVTNSDIMPRSVENSTNPSDSI